MAENIDPTPHADPDIDALIEALAHSLAIRECLRPVLLRMDERHRVRLAVRKCRTNKDAASGERRSA